MTVSGGHPVSQDDPKASLRAELLGQIAAAQFDLEAVIADLTRDGAPASALIESRSQLGALNALSRQMAGASTATLATMRAEIASVVATSQSAAQQARATVAGNPDAAELIHRAEEARAAVNEVMRGMKDFDPYLQFSDKVDEEAYRKRELERQAYITAQQAKGTPQGSLNAANAAVDQMNDAKAHGADRSPDFNDRMTGLTKSRDLLREAITLDANQHQTSAELSRERAESQCAAPPSKLDAAIAAFRDAGVQPAACTDEIVADTVRGAAHEKSQKTTSVQV